MNRRVSRWSCLFILLLSSTAACARAQVDADIDGRLVRAYLWPASQTEFESAEAAIREAPWALHVTRAAMLDLEEIVRAGPPRQPGPAPRVGGELNEMLVETPGGRQVPVWVRLPSDWRPDREWPLMFAMHGGPPGSVEGAIASAMRMVDVWAESTESAGWIVASPAMVDVVSRDGRTADRLPYEIFQPEEARAVVDAVQARFSVNPDRIVSTGISLGSNFSIAYAAAHPDWLSAIVPVSTEGESREGLLRNLAGVPVYVLEGTQDQNIRAVSGPRAMRDILTSFGADHVYREFGDRAHEGFSEHYPDVLRWLDSRPRRSDPKDVLRMPHAGISATSRAVHWVESRDRQGVVRARIVAPTEIRVDARWTGAVRLHLSDRLVDLDRPVTVFVNGEIAFEGRVERSAITALENARIRGMHRHLSSVLLDVDVPLSQGPIRSAVAFSEEHEPQHAEGILSFWEMYAVRALEERFPGVGFDGSEVALPAEVEAGAPEQVAIQIEHVDADSGVGRAGLMAGDVLIRFGGEPFFRDRGGVRSLHHWLMRELRSQSNDYRLDVWRTGRLVTLNASLALGPHLSPGPG
jgi:predicted esterase